MMVIPAGVMPDKPMPVDTLVSVLKRRLRGEKDTSIRRFLYRKLDALREDYPTSQNTEKKDPDPFLVCC
jgi:hypothetical protein